MSLVHRSLLQTFLRILALTLVGALVLFTLVDLLDNIGSFLDNQATLSMVLRYYMYKIVWIVDLVLPIAMLMATLFTVGTMARYNELTALFAAGRSLVQVTQPLLALAVVMSMFSFAWREYVLPEANIARTQVWEVEIHKRAERIRPTTNIALTGGDGRIYFARTFNPQTLTLTGLRVVTTKSAQVVERLDASRAIWAGRYWLLYDGSRRDFAHEEETVTPFDVLPATSLAITPESFEAARVRPEDMNIGQLQRHIDMVRKSGGDVTDSAVDVQFLLAWPVVHIIVVFLGILLASGPRKTTIASGFGWTVLISFGYYLSMNFGRALGHNGTLPPVVAGWAGNGLYGLIGWGLWMRARR